MCLLHGENENILQSWVRWKIRQPCFFFLGFLKCGYSVHLVSEIAALKPNVHVKKLITRKQSPELIEKTSKVLLKYNKLLNIRPRVVKSWQTKTCICVISACCLKVSHIQNLSITNCCYHHGKQLIKEKKPFETRKKK